MCCCVCLSAPVFVASRGHWGNYSCSSYWKRAWEKVTVEKYSPFFCVKLGSIYFFWKEITYSTWHFILCSTQRWKLVWLVLSKDFSDRRVYSPSSVAHWVLFFSGLRVWTSLRDRLERVNKHSSDTPVCLLQTFSLLQVSESHSQIRHTTCWKWRWLQDTFI